MLKNEKMLKQHVLQKHAQKHIFRCFVGAYTFVSKSSPSTGVRKGLQPFSPVALEDSGGARDHVGQSGGGTLLALRAAAFVGRVRRCCQGRTRWPHFKAYA